MFVLVKLLALFNAPKKHVLKQMVIYAALGRLRCHYGNYLTAFMFFNVRIVNFKYIVLY